MANPEDNHFLQSFKTILTPIHKAGVPFIVGFAVVSLILALLVPALGFVGLVLTLWCVYFFRDPIRTTPLREGLMVSPADGLVQTIRTVIPPAELQLGMQERIRVSIFLNVFDVHVNRIPIESKVVAMHYFAGKFLNASLDKASEENERQYLTLETADSTRYGVVQIAGLVARRILCDAQENQQYSTGERFGLIRFGSRTDIYLPVGVHPLVVEGQRAVGGETIIADIKSTELARIGVKH